MCSPESLQEACQGHTGGRCSHMQSLVPQLLSSPTWNPQHPHSTCFLLRFKPVSPVLPPAPERHAPGKEAGGWTPVTVHYPASFSIPLSAYGSYGADPAASDGSTSSRPKRPDASSSWSRMKFMGWWHSLYSGIADGQLIYDPGAEQRNMGNHETAQDPG